MIQLFAVKEQIEIGEVPEHCSVSLAIQIIRTMMQNGAGRPTQSFRERMGSARKDSYQRKRPKKARHRPDGKDKPKAGKPRVRTANREHKARLRRYLNAAV